MSWEDIHTVQMDPVLGSDTRNNKIGGAGGGCRGGADAADKVRAAMVVRK